MTKQCPCGGTHDSDEDRSDRFVYTEPGQLEIVNTDDRKPDKKKKIHIHVER